MQFIIQTSSNILSPVRVLDGHATWMRCACLNPPRHANSHLVCHVPRGLSLDVSLRAKEGGKEKRLRFSSLSFPWSLAFRHQSLSYNARLCSGPKCEKRRSA